MFRMLKTLMIIAIVISLIGYGIIFLGGYDLHSPRDPIRQSDLTKVEATVVGVESPSEVILENNNNEETLKLIGVTVPSPDDNVEQHWPMFSSDEELRTFAEMIESHVEDILIGETVTVHLDSRVEGGDGTRRNLDQWIGFIMLENETELGEYLLERGFAIRRCENTRGRHLYYEKHLEANNRAMRNERGIYKNV